MRHVKPWLKHTLLNPKFDSPALTELLAHLDENIAKPKQCLKNDRTSTVCIHELDGHPIVIKRSNTKSWVHLIRRNFCRSRAFISWDNAHRLEQVGIPTFEPIAAIEERWGPFKGRSYLISSYLSGEQASLIFAHGGQPSCNWPYAAKNIISMLNALGKAFLSHRDLNLSNIILIDNIPYLIDLDSMRQHRWGWLANFYSRQDKKRLMKNWKLLPGVNEAAPKLFETLIEI